MTAVLDSVTELTEAHRGSHALVGSHGGIATGIVAANAGIASLICNDAGVGFMRAGIAALGHLARFGIPAASISHLSARIGDAQDMLFRGRVSWTNGIASQLGVGPGCSAAEAGKRFKRFVSQRKVHIEISDEFRRTELCLTHNSIVLCDSASQISDSDAGRIVFTGSHGGMPGGDPSRAVKAEVALVIFNDAGVGIDEAGISRLPILDQRRIAAACVDCHTAKIGVARSTYEDGTLSRVNETALKRGLRPGMAAKDIMLNIENIKEKQ